MAGGGGVVGVGVGRGEGGGGGGDRKGCGLWAKGVGAGKQA